MSRLFPCLVVASSFIALLAPVHGRVGTASGLGGKIRPVSAPHFHVAELIGAWPKRQHGVRARSSTSGSLPAAAAELRSVPAGPDPMHHHGSPRRPERDVP